MTIREGFHTITPYLTTHSLDGLLAFAKDVLGAVETHRARGAAGGTHVELRVGDSMLMIGGLPSADATASTAMLYLYVADPDALHARALAAGATSVMPPSDTPDGERRAGAEDPFGNTWFFGRPLAERERSREEPPR